jgi:hypothetical protein
MFPTSDAHTIACLCANLASFCFDYTARQKVGGTHLTYSYLKQLPVLPPSTYPACCPWNVALTLRDWFLPRVLELTYTAWDLKPFAEDCGDDGPPYIWDPQRRFQLECELDAAFFHLYGVSSSDAGYILDSFPVVARFDERAYGVYRTKRMVLDLYDALAAAESGGRPYVSPLGSPTRAS